MNEILTEADRIKMKTMLGVEDINDFYFEDIMGGEPVQFTKLYSFKKLLGVGGFGIVVAVREQETDLAIKIITKSSKTQVTESLKVESEILEMCNHPNIVKFKYYKEYFNCVVLAMEWCTEGSLINWLRKKLVRRGQIITAIEEAEQSKPDCMLSLNTDERSCGHYHCKPYEKCVLEEFQEKHESDCREIVKQILEGLKYVHDTHDIIHRDIKPGNILIKKIRKSRDNQIKVKVDEDCKQYGSETKHKPKCIYPEEEDRDEFSYLICDFGLAKNSSNGISDWTNETGGTRLFQAPEQAMSLSYGKPVDVWAVGIIMFYLLTFGKHPISERGFSVNNDQLEDYKEKIINIRKEDIRFEELRCYSSQATSLFGKLCEIKTNLRYQCSSALKHPWITQEKNGAIPLNFHEQMEETNRLVDKLKQIQHFVVVVSMLRDKFIRKDHSRLMDVYKCQIIKEEFLEMTPTPKSKSQEKKLYDSFAKHLSTDTNDSNRSKDLKVSSTKDNKVHFKKGSNKPKLLLRPDLLIKTKTRSHYPTKVHSRMSKGNSSNLSSQPSKTSKKRKTSAARPFSSKKRTNVQTIKVFTGNMRSKNSLKKGEKSLKDLGKTQANITSSKKRKVISKIKCIDTKTLKPNPKFVMSEDSESPYPNTTKFKQISTPVGMMGSQSRKFDIPIRMSALDDDSSSMTVSEENNPQRTTSDTINIQKMLKVCHPKKETCISVPQNIKYSKTKESSQLRSSSDCMFPTVSNRHSSCKNINEPTHLAVTKMPPNNLQNKVNEVRRKATLPGNFQAAFEATGRLSMGKLDFVPPRKSSCGQFIYNAPKTPFHVSNKTRLVHKASFKKHVF